METLNKKIGIAVITCNRPEFYKKCINSIQDEWYDEIITINDGNSEVDSIKGEIISSRSRGVGYAKNVAFRKLLDSGCDYIILVEDDMLFKNNLFEAYIDAHKKTGLHHFMFGYHGPANKNGISGGEPAPRKIIDYGELKIALNYHCVGAVTFYTKQCLEDIGLHDEELINAFEHVEHSYRLANAGYSTPYWWWPDIANSLDYVEEQACSEDSSAIRPRKDWQSNIENSYKVFRRRHKLYPTEVPNVNIAEVLDVLKIRKPKEPISFIVHYREDTEERKKNFDIVYNYYKAIYPSCEFVFVEDGSEKTIEHLVRDEDQYIFNKNDDVYNKCKSYNIGLNKSINNIVCFLDIDCIVSIDSLSKSIKIVNTLEDSICIGYNGIAIYAEYTLKDGVTNTKFSKGIYKLYDYLQSKVDSSNITNLYSTDLYTVGNINAVGGCLIGKRDTFLDINGFNPNFIGWGFEDNEILSRAGQLGKTVTNIMSKDSKYFLFHLPHEDTYKVALNDKSDHKFYAHNAREWKDVSEMTENDLIKYIKTWDLKN